MDYVNGGEVFFHLQNEHKFAPDRVKFYACKDSPPPLLQL
jgi:hypothetical protein